MSNATKEFKKDINNMEKQIYGHIDHINQQNIKMNQLDERLNEVDREAYRAEKYQEVIKDESFFGPVKRFFKGFFIKAPKTKEKQKEEINENKNNKNIKNENDMKNNNQNILKNDKNKPIRNVNEVNNEQDFNDLMAEINEMGKASQQLYDVAVKSNQKAKELHDHIESADKKVKERIIKNKEHIDKYG